MAKDWFVSQKGSNKGPFTFDEVKSLADHNQLTASDDIFDPGQSAWVKAGDISGLIANQVDPTSNNSSSNSNTSRFNLNKTTSATNQNQTQTNTTNTSSNQTNTSSNSNSITDLKTQGFNLFTQFTNSIKALPQDKKNFLLQGLGLLTASTILFLLIGVSTQLGPWLMKVLTCAAAGPAIYYLAIKNNLHNSARKKTIYQISAGVGAFLGILYASRVGTLFPTLFVTGSCMLALLGFCYYQNKQEKPAFVASGTASLALLAALVLPQSGPGTGLLGTNAIETKIVGLWKKDNPVTQIEFTSGGTFLFGKETRKYKIKSGNKIEILYNSSSERVDETLSIDFQNDDEIIIVNSSSFGDLAPITGRFKKTTK